MSGYFRSKKSSKGQRSESSEGTFSNPETTFQGQMTARRASLLETAQRQPEVPLSSRQAAVSRSSRQLWPQTQMENTTRETLFIPEGPTKSAGKSPETRRKDWDPPPPLSAVNRASTPPGIERGRPTLPIPTGFSLVAAAGGLKPDRVSNPSFRASGHRFGVETAQVTTTGQLGRRRGREPDRCRRLGRLELAGKVGSGCRAAYVAKIHAIQQAQQQQMFQYMQNFTAAQLQGLPASPMPTAIPLPQPPQPPQETPQQPPEADINLDDLDFV
ncbi:hypothetical protein ACLB2K_035477 [Fragaria x ananassa]